MSEKYLDFIGIGTGKSGTKLLIQLLDEHPQICFSVPNNVLYFNLYNTIGSANRMNKRMGKSILWYLNHFKHCPESTIKGEFSSVYFCDSDAPKNIFNAFPNIKLIVSFRNPVERAYDHYQIAKNYHGIEHRTFTQAIYEEKDYIERGLYFKHLSRWLTYFDKSQIFILTFEELNNTPLDVLQRFYRFMGVDDRFVPLNIHLKANYMKKTKCKSIKNVESYIVRTISAFGGSPIIQWLKKKNFHEWFHKLYLKPYHYTPLKEEDRIWLKQLFLEDIEQLEEFLKMDLSNWK